MIDQTTLYWQPYVSPLWLTIIAVIFFGLSVFLYTKTKRIYIWRIFFMALILFILSNPVWRYEAGLQTRTTVYVVVDKTDSQMLAGRLDQVDEVFKHIKSKLDENPKIETKVITLDRENGGHGTRIFTALQQAFLQEDVSKLGGSILITDGQVQDIPDRVEFWERFGPVHVMMTGDPYQEWDRRVEIISSAKYSVVGEELPVRFKVEEDPYSRDSALTVKVENNGSLVTTMQVMPGTEQYVRIPIEKPGDNVISLSVEVNEAELSLINNTASIKVEGIRDRLKVLLVSGQPHQGLRIWRNLLKSDPAVELVHFTILRSRSNIDITPQSELALIPFPTQELFEDKINEFDLIILDRYTRRSILASAYFDNIVNYVDTGGALLAVHGPEEVADQALAETSISKILPAVRQKNSVFNQSYKAKVSDFGVKHPVTEPLSLIEDRWGNWDYYLRMQPQAEGAKVLLRHENGDPLLLISEYGDGRVAQFTTDQMWYWARGYKGGGPYTDLIRRLSHWLMKEPTLEYKKFDVRPTNTGLEVVYDADRRGDEQLEVNVRTPQGFDATIKMEKSGIHPYKGFYEPEYAGVYGFSIEGEHSYYLYEGNEQDNIELKKLISNPDALKQISSATKGRIIAYDDFYDADVKLKSGAAKILGGQTLQFNQSRNLENRTVDFRQVVHYLLLGLIGLFVLLMAWLRQE